MKKQIVFLSVIFGLSGIITPILGVTSARYKALWRKQLAEQRASKVVDNSQDVNSEPLQNEQEERTVTPAVQELAQVSQKKEKSFFEKYASKLAATLVGAAIIGAYELFAESNPGTVPAIGLKDMFSSLLNSVLSLFGFDGDVDVTAEKAVVGDIPADIPTHQSATSSASTTTTQPEIIQPVRQSTTVPVAEELTTTATSTTSNTPVVQPIDKGVAHVSDQDDLFKTLSFSDDEDIQIEQPTVIVTPDDKGAPLVSGEDDSFATISVGDEDDSVYYSMSRSEDEDTEDEKKVIEIKEEIKPVVVQKTEPKNGDVRAVSTALDKLIAYAQGTGNWFLNLFDTEKNTTPYNQYVDTFGVLIEQMEKDVNKVDGTNSMLQATKDFASFLVRQLKETHKTFNGHKISSSWSITPTGIKAMALGYALKNHVSDAVKAERITAFENLRKQFNGHPGLDAKIIHLQEMMSGFGDEIEKKDQSVLLAGLIHRLKL